MDEEAPVRREPPGDPRQQRLVVARVFEHLDRDDAVEAPRRLEIVDVGGHHVEIRQAALRGAREDELALGLRVRHGENAAARMPFRDVQRE